MHLSTQFGADVSIKLGDITFFFKFKMVDTTIWDF